MRLIGTFSDLKEYTNQLSELTQWEVVILNIPDDVVTHAHNYFRKPINCAVSDSSLFWFSLVEMSDFLQFFEVFLVCLVYNLKVLTTVKCFFQVLLNIISVLINMYEIVKFYDDVHYVCPFNHIYPTKKRVTKARYNDGIKYPATIIAKNGKLKLTISYFIYCTVIFILYCTNTLFIT